MTDESTRNAPSPSSFISHLHIENFLGNQCLDWSLQKTNVLVGANGSGKSTLLRILRQLFIDPPKDPTNSSLAPASNLLTPACANMSNKGNSNRGDLPQTAITVMFDNGEQIQWQSNQPLPQNTQRLRDTVQMVYLATFDANIIGGETSHQQQTQLDQLLHAEINQFKSYQLRLNYQLRQQCRDASALADFITLEQHIFSPLRRFESLCKHFFSGSGKRFESLEDGGIVFDQHGYTIQPWQLSSGEKQLLLLLLKALNNSEHPSIFLLDEPEISLHLAWQEKLLDALHQINPDSQIIVVTHSPAIVMDGWIDCEVDIESLLQPQPTA